MNLLLQLPNILLFSFIQWFTHFVSDVNMSSENVMETVIISYPLGKTRIILKKTFFVWLQIL